MRSIRQCPRLALALPLLVAIGIGLRPRPVAAAPESFPAGSLIIPMDLAYQDRGLLQAYGLLFQLLRQGVPVAWVIAPDKTWHAAPCDTAGDLCAWDCAVEGSGVKCPYPTASPDFFATTEVVWDDTGAAARGAVVGNHGYRGGPFVVRAAHRDAALAVIDAWNDQARWTASPWARRTVFRVVTVHSATAAFTAEVNRELVAAPTIAVFSDGNEDIATGYLRAAGIPQSSGAEFPASRCGNGTCGPGTANPDMLTVPSIMGDMGTCDAPNLDHKNGALFTDDGVPAYCQIMSMHWGVNDRETVECGGGACPATAAECAGEPITYHGHEVVAEVRQFLRYPVHFFAECQAVNAYENTTPDPAWPYLDDDARDGHFLTTEGMPPACPCTDAEFECVAGGCNGVDCCLPRDVKEQGAGFMIAAQPAQVKVLHPEVPYNQLDGAFETTGGSEPAYNLSAYLGTTYKNDREVVFLTGPDGPGVQDVWMTGYVDGECDIVPIGGPGSGTFGPQVCGSGKVSYLGGHSYGTATPVSSNQSSQGARMFLNALFEADCVSSVGQPALGLSLDGPLVLGARAVPAEATYSARYVNGALGPALDAVLAEQVAAGVTIVDAAGATIAGDLATWTVGSIGGTPGVTGDPPSSGGRPSTLRFADYGDHTITLSLAYRVGLSTRTITTSVTVRVAPDRDGDGIPDADDPFPDDPARCGDVDSDTCDDCSQGPANPASDGPDADGDGICDAGEDPGATGDSSGGCCRASGPGDATTAGALGLLVLLTLRPRRRRVGTGSMGASQRLPV